MDANIACEFILKHIKSSNLNFVLQETPYSAYITIRKSLVKNRDSVIPESTVESGEALYDKIKVLQAENVSLKMDLHKLKSVAKNSDDKILELEVQLKNTLENVDDSNKVKKRKAQLEAIVIEKEKEIVKLKNIAKTFQNDNAVVRNNLQNVTKTLKLNEKDKFRAQVKSENLEETVKKLKEEKADLQKSLKKLQKNKKTKPFENNNNPLEELADTIDTEVPEAKNIELDINEKETELIAYNIPVDNPFETLAMNHFVTNENKTITDDANDVFEVDLGETVEKKNDSGDKYKVFDEAFLKAFQDYWV